MNNEPIRIAQIMGKMNSGGVESVVMNYYRNIDKNKVQFDFIVDEDSKNIPKEEIENMGGKIILVPPYKNILSYMNILKNILRKGNYKIVHSHLNTLSVFSLYAAKMAYDNDEVKLINNAIDVDKFIYNEEIRNIVRKEFDFENKFVIGHVGRFVDQKNHTGLIDIFNEIYKANKESILLLAGDGPLLKSIRDKVDSLNLTDAVKFLGVRSDINNIMQCIDVFLLPSLYEGLPVVGVEAQASGSLCILSSNMTKETKVIETTKFLPISDEPKAWAKYILEEYKNFKRKDTKQEIINSNFEIKSEATKLQNDYLKLYRNLSL